MQVRHQLGIGGWTPGILGGKIHRSWCQIECGVRDMARSRKLGLLDGNTIQGKKITLEENWI